MKNTIPFLFLSLLILGNKTSAQSWGVHLNGNSTFPISNDRKGQYPILWYDSDQDPSILVGGFGAGVSYQRPWRGNTQLKFQLNAQRSRFYDEPTIFWDANGQPILGVIGINNNLNASVLSLVLLPITENQKWLLGVGLGLRGTFFSKTDYGEAFVDGEKASLKLKNKSLAPVVAILPIELTKYFGERFSVTTRAETALSGTSRLSANKKERTMVVLVEVGYRFGK